MYVECTKQGKCPDQDADSAKPVCFRCKWNKKNEGFDGILCDESERFREQGYN